MPRGLLRAVPRGPDLHPPPPTRPVAAHHRPPPPPALLHPPPPARAAPVARLRVGDRPGVCSRVGSARTPCRRGSAAVEAPTRLGRHLLVVGTGPEERRLRTLAGPTVELLGWRDDSEIAGLYAACRALLFPPLEDFGITPLEAMAAGRPVIAFGQGGALETVVPPGRGESPTGLFFEHQP